MLNLKTIARLKWVSWASEILRDLGLQFGRENVHSSISSWLTYPIVVAVIIDIGCTPTGPTMVNTVRPEQSGWRIVDSIFKCIQCCILVQISLADVSCGPINKLALVPAEQATNQSLNLIHCRICASLDVNGFNLVFNNLPELCCWLDLNYKLA